MNRKNKNSDLSPEKEMIRDLRKRIYGQSDAGPELPVSDKNCVFCGSKSDLKKYKDSYICNECLNGILN
ncbi:hypothetical protein [Halanaerobium praevalens]|uniref:Uncharacterized protein n=1 Tax=Halanaerobium praevalens (strain ATCC 33744 / DSM 2228 / GSL) TaxID=572479 RepID=E3DQ39_HALPG|nr:hypothetical protein [Halanaerobium praevalens]ADO76790.1 hypothetical protein Hprae_0636 [Halanaerobium praevalens DSM 2228]